MTAPVQPPLERQKVAPARTRKAGITIPVLPHACPKCNLRWGGLKTAHCTACHETFTAVSTFDRHRTGSHAKGARQCLLPADVGLVDAGRSYPCWAAGTWDREDDE